MAIGKAAGIGETKGKSPNRKNEMSEEDKSPDQNHEPQHFILTSIGQTLMNVLIAIDIVGNTLCGGSRWHTISARTGYFACNNNATQHSRLWKFLAFVIDLSFLPWQGWGHCFDAWCSEAKVVGSEKFKNGFCLGNGIACYSYCDILPARIRGRLSNLDS
ncbi:MAG: hypothetical protein OXG24_03540 [Gammaproteobacteria bacterium]|nr:hypothetical protein [Gammaproteobacteria bacterium]